LYRLVIDSSALIPCGEKREEDIESIKEFGNRLPEIAEKFGVVLALSKKILEEYSSSVKVGMRKCAGHLPKFHASFYRNLDRIIRLGNLKKCVARTLSELGVRAHVIEASREGKFEVSEFVKDREDEKFVKTALVVASSGGVYIITVDSQLLALAEERNYKRFCKRFEYGRNVKVVKPGTFVNMVESL